jgi:hypothetical protein
MRRLAFTLVPLLLLAACSEQPTASKQAAPAPSFDFSNGPATPGHSYIVRSAYGGFAWYFVDPVTELAALVTDEACSAFAEATLVPVQNIFNPAEEGLQMYLESGFLNAAILEPPYACDDILATGRVKNSWHDNDVYAWAFDHHRANAWGGGITGRVGPYKVMWEFHAVWGGLGNPDFHGAFVERISIR